MPNFNDFKSAHKAGVADLVGATKAQAELEAARHAKEVAMRRGNAAGIINTYDKVTGKNTPIQNYLSDALRGSDMAATPAPVTDMSTYSDASGNIIGQAGLDQYDSMSNLNTPTATDIPLGMDTATGAVDPALQAGDLSAALRGGDAAGGFDASGVPIISALTGVNQLANGDVGGAAGTGLKAGLATLGPWGALAGLGLGLTGLV